MKKQFRSLGAAIALVSCAGLASAQSVEDVVAKHLAALGGADAIAKIVAVEREADVKVEGQFGPMEGLMAMKSVPGKKSFQELDLGVFYRVSGWDGGEKGWEENAMEGEKEIEGDGLNLLKAQSQVSPFLNYKENGVNVELGEDAAFERLPTLEELAAAASAPPAGADAASEPAPEREKVDCHVLLVGPAEGNKSKFCIDKATGMIFQVRTTQENPQFGEMEMVVEYSDFEEHEGVKFVKTMKIATGEIFTMEATYTTTTVNGEIDPTVFQPPSAKAPADPAAAPAAPADPA